MNEIQQRYVNARRRFLEVCDKKLRTEEALGILTRDWQSLSRDEFQYEAEIEANIEGFFGVDVARAELKEAVRELLEWGLDRAFCLPEAQPFYPMLQAFQKDRDTGLEFGSRWYTDVINLMLKLETDRFPIPKRG